MESLSTDRVNEESTNQSADDFTPTPTNTELVVVTNSPESTNIDTLPPPSNLSPEQTQTESIHLTPPSSEQQQIEESEQVHILLMQIEVVKSFFRSRKQLRKIFNRWLNFQ